MRCPVCLNYIHQCGKTRACVPYDPPAPIGDDRINPDLLLSTPVDDVGQSEEPPELCTRDNAPCWVEGDDAHWRCGTVQCGSKMAGGTP